MGCTQGKQATITIVHNEKVLLEEKINKTSINEMKQAVLQHHPEFGIRVFIFVCEDKKIQSD